MRRVILWRPLKIRRAQIIGLGMAAEPFLDGEERLPMVLSFGHHGPHRLHPFLLLGGLRTLHQRLQNSAVQPIDRLRRRFEADESSMAAFVAARNSTGLIEPIVAPGTCAATASAGVKPPGGDRLASTSLTARTCRISPIAMRNISSNAAVRSPSSGSG